MTLPLMVGDIMEMINSLDLKNRIISALKQLPVCKPTSNLRNYVVRCPYCGDSSNQTHGHFSIRIDLNSDSPMIYRCFRCNDSGLVTNQTLEDLGVYIGNDEKRNLDIYNRFSHNPEYFRDKVKDFKIIPPLETYENARKLDYINQRLGLHLGYDDCARLKLVPSIVEFMRGNNIRLSDRVDGKSINLPLKTIKELEEHYLGFLSSNNNKITFRDVTPNQTGYFGRYYKLTIDVLNQTPNTFYGLSNKFDPLYTGEMHVHIAEGTFDIISIYENLIKSSGEVPQNALFFAACGYGFSTIMKYLVYLGICTDVVLELYSDNDKDDRAHRRELMKNDNDLWIDKVIIHRNGFGGEKDFGVPKDRISEYSYELKK